MRERPRHPPQMATDARRDDAWQAGDEVLYAEAPQLERIFR